MRVAGHVAGRCRLTAPWGLRIPGAVGSHFHVVTAGTCCLLRDDAAPLPLRAGDLVFLPPGLDHDLVDDPSTPPVPITQVIEAPGETDVCPLVSHGGAGAAVELTCSRFEFEGGHEHPLLALLPELIHIPGQDGRAAPWLDTTLQLIAGELRDAIRPSAARSA